MDVNREAVPADPSALVLFEAIATHRRVAAIYNGMDVRLAPHVLYTRSGMLYLGAFVTARRGVTVPERKLGIFKVAGLRETMLRPDTFEIDPSFDRADPRYATTTVFIVES